MNKAVLIGNVGIDPEVKYLDSGMAVANFNLATNESFKNKNGEKVTNTEWHKIVVWGKTAEIVEKYVKRGSQIAVEGKIRTRNYENKEGQKVYVTEIFVDKLELLGRASGGSDNGEARVRQQAEIAGFDHSYSRGQSQAHQEPVQFPEPVGDDDLPF